MCNSESNIRFSWQLVSQFVSWDFCRYVCDPNDNNSSENDVLTFLRNMIVQRTEKSVSDITKHEIVAKFIMETKAIQDISRMPCITTLSETVKSICPELDPAISKLIHHLDAFLNVLDYNEESQKEELIKLRIEDAINDFCKEANRLLPTPDLLKVIENWNHHHEKFHHKPSKKVVYNAAVFEKVLECLHHERITSSEAKLIALSLYEDKEFDRILTSVETESRTEADSEQFSFQSSQPQEHIFSQEFLKSAESGKSNEIPPTQHPGVANSYKPNVSTAIPNLQQQVQNILTYAPEEQLQFTDDPPELIPMVASPAQSPPLNHHPNNNDSRRPVLERTSDNHMQFAQSSAQDSDSDEPPYNLLRRINSRLNNRNIYCVQNDSDSDSDCDKNAAFRFLTPTFYKNENGKGPPKPIYLSDNESNDSSVVTATYGSQKEDPNWCVSDPRLLPSTASSFSRSIQRRMTTRKNVRFPAENADDSFSRVPVTRYRSNNARFLDTDSDDSVIEMESSEVHRNGIIQPQPSTSRDTSEPSTKRKRLTKAVKLYRSPNTSIQDFLPHIRRPVAVTTNEVPVHIGVNTKAPKKTPSSKSNSRSKKCKQCKRSYKTVIALRRHIFLEHTAPADGGDD